MEGVYKCKFTNVYSRLECAGEPAGYEFPVPVLEACVGVGSLTRGDWFLGISKKIFMHRPTLTPFRPEPGFFDWGSMTP